MTSCLQPHFIAHRGASYLAPENSKASMNLAWELKAAGAECDVMLTRDHQVILFHDKDGKRLLDRDLVISETDYDDVKKLPLKLKDGNLAKYQGATIPLLKDILVDLPKNQLLVIEIKDKIEILPHLKKVVDTHWKQGSIAFIAFDYNTILEIKKLYPKVPCYYLSSTIEDIEKRFEGIKTSDLDGVDLNFNIIDAKLVKRFRDVNKEVWCWTVNTPEDASKMLELGVSYITTDRPKWLTTQL
ncbi:MAG: hypothetical protein HKN87_05495 [Saprospiraceae bacterium]|nr:hypothetical protein [Saprospiraceae bacterium]